MATLFRLRRFHTFTTHSPLHHRFLSTSNSGGGDNNSGGGDPNSDPTNPGGDSNQQSDKKLLEQIRVSSVSFRNRYTIVRQVLSELKESREAFRNETCYNYNVFLNRFFVSRRVQTPENLRNELNIFIPSMMRLKEITMEDAEISRVLTNSRLASLEEIIKSFSEVSKDLQHDEEFGKIWNELNDGLVKGREIEVKEAEMLAVEFKDELDFISHSIKVQSEIYSGIPGDDDDPNSNYPFPSFVREIMETIKLLSPASPPNTTTSTFSCPPSFNPKQASLNEEQGESANSEPTKKPRGSDEQLEKKFEQLRESLLSLKHRQAIDDQLLSELKGSINAFPNEVVKNLSQLPRMREILRKKLKTLMTRSMRLKEMIVEGAVLAEVLTNSRLDSLEEIIENFRETIEYWCSLNEEFDKTWHEILDETRAIKDEEGELFAVETNDEPLPQTPEILGKKFKALITRLTRLNDILTEITEPLCSLKDLINDYPEIRKHYTSLDDIWDKLCDRLTVEFRGARLLAEKTNGNLAFLSELIKNLSGPS